MRKILLLLCLAFAVVGFGYPCVIFPYTNYTVTMQNPLDESKQYSVTYNFKFNGKVRMSSSESDKSEEYFYKLDLKKREVVISDSKKFEEDSSSRLKINNIYELSTGLDFITGTAKNKIAMFSSIGVGALALILIITYPSRRK